MILVHSTSARKIKIWRVPRVSRATRNDSVTPIIIPGAFSRNIADLDTLRFSPQLIFYYIKTVEFFGTLTVKEMYKTQHNVYSKRFKTFYNSKK
jgi:hypothetical protein